MHFIRTFYYDLWAEMPVWLLFLSIWLQVHLVILVDSSKAGFFGGVSIAVILLFTNVIFSVFGKIIPFKNPKKSILKYCYILSRTVLYFLLSTVLAVVFEQFVLCFFYQVFLEKESLFPHFAIVCMVLSQYGAYPAKNTLKKTVSNSLGNGIGFTIFLIVAGFSADLIRHYLPESVVSKMVGVMGLILIATISKVRAYKNQVSQRQNITSIVE